MQSPAGSFPSTPSGVPYSPMAISSYPSLGSLPTRSYGQPDFAVGCACLAAL